MRIRGGVEVRVELTEWGLGHCWEISPLDPHGDKQRVPRASCIACKPASFPHFTPNLGNKATVCIEAR